MDIILTAFQADALRALDFQDARLNVIGRNDGAIIYVDDVWAPLSANEAGTLVEAHLLTEVEAVAPYDFSYTLSELGRDLVKGLGE